MRAISLKVFNFKKLASSITSISTLDSFRRFNTRRLRSVTFPEVLHISNFQVLKLATPQQNNLQGLAYIRRVQYRAYLFFSAAYSAVYKHRKLQIYLLLVVQ